MRNKVKLLFEYIIVILLISTVIEGLYLIFVRKHVFSYAKLSVVISVICSAILMLFANRFIKYLSNVRYLKSSLSKIDKMSGEEFEIYLMKYFEKMKYRVELTPFSNDYGADLICRKNDEVLVVQAKRYEGKVGNAAIQQVVAARDYYEADSCMVVTNSYFTKNAYSLAEANDVLLWDRDDIEKNIKG